MMWRCFHCNAQFRSYPKAAEHFGTSERQQPACRIDIAEYRRMEEVNRRHCEEDTELHREIYRLHGVINETARRKEEEGYARGLRDALRFPADAIPDAMVEAGALVMCGEEAFKDAGNAEWARGCVRRVLAAAHGVTAAPALRPDSDRLDWIARQGDEFSSGILQDCPGDGDHYVNGMGDVRGTGKTFREALDNARGVNPSRGGER